MQFTSSPFIYSFNTTKNDIQTNSSKTVQPSTRNIQAAA